MITITMNDDYSLSSDSNIIPAQHSANILFYFDVLAEYADSLIVPGYIYYDGCTKVESAVDNYSNGEFTIPANAFSNEGVLAIAFAITTGEETVTTTPVEFEVRGSVNTSFSLPSTEIWQSMLQSFMDQYMDKVYSDEIRILIDKCKELQANGEILQELINLAINSCGQYKFENGFLFFKQADGSYGEGINLNVSVEEFENVVRRVTNLETNGVAVGDTLPIGTIVYVEGDEKDLRTGYEKIDVFPPKQLLINNDFQVNQRAKTYTSNEYTLDMWYKHKNGSGTVGNVEKIDNGIRIVNEDYTNVFLNQKISNYYKGKTVTIVGKFNNVIGSAYLRISKATSIGINNVAYGNVEITEDGIFTTTVDIPLDGLDSYEYLKVQIAVKSNSSVEIEYIDMFEGEVAYPHRKEDYTIALLKCQRFVREIEINKSGYVAGSIGVKGTINFCIEMNAIPSFVITSVGTRQNVASAGIEVNNKRLIYTITTSTAGYFTLEGYKLIVSCEPL